ncbi:hypothetical protein [Actinoallomurus rhizosphaericola]|uniref:hypothetical protein n=1 Tax=Actinoallomurus rhizosphaericola TaxID=2952536 RepID=UPI002092FD3E|nr:hypothetical protein [Actinoallomurus rhizosphaericola]MCO5999025.1 hypothetical protein [Actinoallomurus rhizosphaericola]
MTLQTVNTILEPAVKPGAQAMGNGWGYFTANGDVILDVGASWITPSTLVYASIVEVGDDNVPKIGDARMAVHNIEPYQGGIRTWVNIEWGSPLRVRVSYCWSE